MQFLKDYLMRDVEDENESGRAAYILRFTVLTLFLFHLIFTVALAAFGLYIPSTLSALCSLSSSVTLYFTYRNRTRLSLNLFYATSVLWVIAGVYLVGWDCGIQHLTFVLLLFIFTTSYRSPKIKILESLCIYLLRLSLYFYTLYHEPIYPVSQNAGILLQILSTTAVFLLLILIMTVFASDALRAEGKLARANRKLNTLAGTDELTKLANRRHAMKMIKDFAKETGYQCAPTLAIGDIDFFKKVNDTYGHEAGDRVLEVLSELFRQTMEPYGFCARWGGEEFLFFFSHMNIDNASIILQDLLTKIRVTVIPYGTEQIKVTMTFGLCDTVLTDGEEEVVPEIEKALQSADERLYMGKQSGRNRVVG